MNPSQGGPCSVIGLHPEEIAWVRRLVTLLRHPDPLAAELARRALEYVQEVADGGAGDLRTAAKG